jgi:lysophospholipase L1-like esterase
LRRLIVVALSLIASVTGCQHAPPEYVSRYTPSASIGAPPTIGPADAAPVAIIGDSFTKGTQFGGQGPDGWPALVAAQLRHQGIDIAPFVEAEEGSGYVTPGNNEGNVFADQISKVVRPNDRVVIVFASGSNSDDVAADQLQPAVRQTLDAIRAEAPQARLVVIGPVSLKPDPPATTLQTRDIIRTEVQAVGADFVDPIDTGWFLDRPDLITPDGIHPNDAGHAYIAEKIAPLIVQEMQSP